MVFLRKLPGRFGWLLVMAAGLGISTWSLYDLGHRHGMPPELALVLSLALDGGALVLADTRMSHAREGESGGVARLGMLGALATSGYLNVAHAQGLNWGATGAVLLAAPGLLAGLVFEVKSRHAYRVALAQHGRIAPPLPPFGLPAWLLHPLSVFGAIRAITASRIASIPLDALDFQAVTLDTEETSQLAHWDVAVDGRLLRAATPPAWETMTKTAAVERADGLLLDRTAPQLAAALAEVGVEITDGGVRTARSRLTNRTAT